ncbi:hypothetical protein J4448_02220 [Candidatus Woesearchaeota archaeon]|nr:hypothetical protein [Candidatus Woesearchaeota archaeon]
MNKRYLTFLLFTVALIFILSCSPIQEAPKTTITPKTESSTSTKTQAETTQSTAEISADVKELLNKHKTKVSSIYYKYRGPETGSNFHEFYIKGNKIKYKPSLEIKTLDQPGSYDAIFIDKVAKTAQSYCTAAYCAYKGKKADLSYATAYISTVFDWIDVTSAEKVGEEVINSRNTWKIETNKGILWVDTFYGIPLKIESGGKTYKFEQLAVNSVTDADVVPS